MDFRAIVFDLDGTLIDSVPDVRAAMNRVLTSQGHPEISLDQALTLVGEGARAMVEKAMALGGTPAPEARLDDLVADYIGYYRRYPVVHTRIYPGVIAVLDSLAQRGVRLGICTNKPLVMTELVLRTLGLDKYFGGVASGDSVPHRKPDGRHVEHTLKLMGAGKARAVMVGDSETDVAAGKDAGLPVVAVTYGYARVPAEGLGADVLIDDFAALPGALDDIARRSA